MLRLSLLLVCAAALLTAPAQAQFIKAYGVKAGANSSRVDLEGDDGFDSRTGFQAGVFVELGAPLLPVSVLAEVEYARRGYEQSTIQTDAVGTEGREIVASTALHFVSVPVLARVRLPGAVVATPYVVAGPRLDLLVASDPGRFDFVGLPDSPVFEDPFPEIMQTASVSGVVGAGLGLGGLIGPEVRVEVRYGFGLTDLSEVEAVGMNQRGLDVSLGLAF
jgi:hypothetical protein